MMKKKPSRTPADPSGRLFHFCLCCYLFSNLSRWQFEKNVISHINGNGALYVVYVFR